MTINPSFNFPEAVAHYSGFETLFSKEVEAFRAIPDKATILDLGCGAGRTTAHLLSRGHRVFAADIALLLLQEAARRLPGIPLCAADAVRLPFRPCCFDAALFSFNGIDYIFPDTDRLAVFDEVLRVLRPGGLFLFSAHNNCLPRGLDGVIPFLRSLFKKDRSTLIQDSLFPGRLTTTRLTTPDLQVAELKARGFEGIEVITRPSLRRVRSWKLIGWLDDWCYYLCRAPA